MAKDIDITDDGDNYIVKIGELALATFADLDRAVARKTEIEDAIKLDESGKIAESTLRHRTGWEYTGQISLPPELFISDYETELSFLTKIVALEDKLVAVEIG